MLRWLGLLGLRFGGLYGLRFAVMFAGCLFLFWQQGRVYQLDVDFEARIPTGAAAEVFYTFDGRSHYPENRRIMSRDVQTGYTRFNARLRTNQPIRSIRVDPSNEKGEVFWRSITLTGPSGRQHAEGLALPQVVIGYLHLQILDSGPAGQRMLSTTIDPQIAIPVDPAITAIPATERWLNRLTFLLWSLLIAGSVEWILQVLRRSHPLNIAATRWLGAIGHRMSDDATIRFSPSAVLVYLLLLVVSVVWIALKLNLSSISIWDGNYPVEHIDRFISLGSPKTIRSDEWGVLTPWMLNQVQNGMPSDNPNIGPPGAPTLAGVPVMNLLMIAQPKYWGFFLLDIERGYSWVWAFKTFGLIAAFFTLLLLVTAGNTAVALGGAVGMWGASYVQWWLSSVPSESITGFSMAVVGAVYLLQARKTGGLLFGALVVPLSVGFLMLHMYPAYLLALAYLSVFMLVALLARPAAWQRFLLRLPMRAGLMLAALLGTALLAWLFYLEVHEAAQVIMNTTYPGQRFSLGGDYPWHIVFSGVFESLKIGDDVMPFPPTNPSEASNFWVLFPLALLLVPLRRWFDPSYRLVAALMAFCLLCVLWMSVPLPTALRQAVAQTGWYLAPAARVQFGLAVASFILMAVLVAGVARGTFVLIRVPSPWVGALAFLAAAAYGHHLQAIDPAFFTLGRVALGAACVALFAWAVHQGRSKVYLGLSILVALPTLYVNPLNSGLTPYLNKAIFQEARRLGGAAHDRWAVYGDIYLAQGFKGAGLNVLNGTNYAPRPKLFESLDPESRYKTVWNRFAHIELAKGVAGMAPIFELDVLDHYRIRLDVCGQHIRQAGVTRVAFAYAPTAEETECLEPLLVEHFSSVSLYRFKQP